MRTLVLLALIVVAALAIAPIHLAHPNHRVAGSYLVVYHSDVDQTIVDGHKTTLLSLDNGANAIKFHYTDVLKGYAGNFSKQAIEFLRNSAEVDFIEEDQMMYADVCVGPESAASWGLARIASRSQTTTYRYDNAAGNTVTAYIIDTGIYTSHNDFEGRARFGWKADSSWSNNDGNGHGTHVAGTVGGLRYGVAKKTTLVAVKVLGDNGSGTTAGVVAGVDWVAGQKRASPNSKMVANMSLGGGASTALDNAVNNCVSAGVAVAVAAGNDGLNACNYSPARAKDAFTVGSSTSADARSSFSNIGTCVEIFAPGTSITAPWINGVNAVNTISGTSMASPHVCGALAALLDRENLTPAQLKTRLLSTGTSNVLSGVGTGSPNLLLYSQFC
jgi:subtilisin family serine protease